jgi:putative flippase GtrA
MKQGKIVRFVLIGGFATCVNLAARAVLDLATSYEVAIVLAFPIALTTAFTLNRTFVFDGSTGDWKLQYWRFFLVNLATLAQILLVSVAFARFILPAIGFRWHAELVAHAIGLLSPIPTSYWAHKRFTFTSRT